MGSQVPELTEKAAQQEETEKMNKKSADFSLSSSVVRWERFLPKMVVRVLLVEADDSTRQIIAALLRKCSYRVAEVSDGIKAWEILKGRPDKIDLILTEVELPSISGYALLTLIMEHDVCKKIPVIMMSSHDSISTVYKCMLRGAADFLVKPVRKNELRNLWQHVWRKQASSNSAGPGPPEESVAQPKIEDTAENNAASNHSSAQRNRQCSDKGTDAESSCGNLEFETWETRIVTNSRMHSNVEFNGGHDVEEAMNLIGTFNKGNVNDAISKVTSSKFDVSPLLDLSLMRSNPSRSLDQNNDGRPRLNHSDASAFSWYINKPLQPKLDSTCNQQKENDETNLEKQQRSHSPLHNPETHGATTSYRKHLSVAKIQPFSYPQKKEISHPIPIRGARFEQDANNALDSMHSSLSPLSSEYYSRTDRHFSASRRYHNLMDQRVTGGVDSRGHELEDQEHDAPVCDQNMYCGNNGKVNAVVDDSSASQCGNEVSRVSHRSLQREAALNKFRLKRKDRCFEKKVRYESRKKLAEQRPRVKGQFVRQVPNDPQPGNSSAD